MLADFVQMVQPSIDLELQRVVSHPFFQHYPGLESILRYHLGWEKDGSPSGGQGKRVRPLLVLLAAEAVGADWRCALPSAAAVELLHNFSLIHDDIEDRGSTRRGRETVWKIWGEALAINAGDAMLALSFDALKRLTETVSPEAALKSMQILTDTCLNLTGGQHLDISFERERSLDWDQYLAMIGGKTAALLSSCMRLGAVAGGAAPEIEAQLGKYGHYLGLSFQAWDDWLGIWGDGVETGKSIESDLVAGKKTMPVVYALERKGRFAERWLNGPILPAEVAELSRLLVEEGVQAYVERQVEKLTATALQALQQAECAPEAGENLAELARSLLKRKK